MIDEMAARRPDFLDGPPVAFPGGVTLHLPRTSSYYFPADDEKGFGVGYRFRGASPPEDQTDEAFAAAVDALDSAQTDAEIVSATMKLGARLIRRNYSLPEEQVRDLLTYTVGDPESLATFLAIGRLARGLLPEPAAAELAEVGG